MSEHTMAQSPMATRPKLHYGGTDYLCLVRDEMPEEIGRLFAEMDAAQQARFFAAVAAATTRYERAASFQWADMAPRLTAPARGVIRDMADHIE